MQWTAINIQYIWNYTFHLNQLCDSLLLLASIKLWSYSSVMRITMSSINYSNMLAQLTKWEVIIGVYCKFLSSEQFPFRTNKTKWNKSKARSNFLHKQFWDFNWEEQKHTKNHNESIHIFGRNFRRNLRMLSVWGFRWNGKT